MKLIKHMIPVLVCVPLLASASDTRVNVSIENPDSSIASVEQMSDAHARFTFRVIKSMSKDAKFASYSEIQDVAAVAIEKAEQDVAQREAKVCMDLVNYDISDVAASVKYFFNALNGLDSYEEQKQREALIGLPVSLLNVVSEANITQVTTTTAESILKNGGTEWLLDQKGLCVNKLIEKGVQNND
ncbi:hypothetical protein [Pseudoalteromonas luteoviolacea]|uniref:Uncharacterized protein n=1 Tax=Pseudoalteromonas luteoviolacea (strain 2ta16) TaxID=1353533 RepID=V4HSU5_PSEL2|nr:hypothetical protein [Pseudoalteromonas luteoviolacea]ESP92833.1 hypothetical protein PL2TA16_04031 [Pseudoalteromonas luteoviolacea 2ta16]KZN35646.1 hypothetical protein N483_01415 [Pseudoalteromonas luteoviolacea NCIMB 1944]